MRRILPAFLTVLLVGAALGYTAHAQWGGSNNGVPEIITYRGYLEDSSTGVPVPVSGNKDMTFSLYTAASGGSAIWTCNAPAVPVLGGHFEVQLGAISGCQPFSDIAGEKPFDRQELYLQIQVGTTPLTSRQRLTSSPYAIGASQADNFRVSGTLNVTGATTLASLTASSLSVTGSSSLNATTVTGNLNVTGDITNLTTHGPYLAVTSSTTSHTVTMISTTDSVCYLTFIQYAASATQGSCSIGTSGGNWQVTANQTVASGVTSCTARCLSW